MEAGTAALLADVGFASREGGYAGAGGFGFAGPDRVEGPEPDRREAEDRPPAGPGRGAFWRRWLNRW